MKTSPYQHLNLNIRFYLLFIRYLKVINKPQSEMWTAQDCKALAMFMAKSRSNYNLLKLKLAGYRKATRLDCELLEEKLNINL